MAQRMDRPGPKLRAVDGCVPPHDLDAEAAVLSAVLLEKDALGRVLETLKAEHFYSEANRRVYEAAIVLDEKGEPIDVVSVAGVLRDRDRLAQCGGAAYLAQLVDCVPSVAHVETYAARVVEKWRTRRLIALGQQIAAEGYVGATSDSLADTIREELDQLPTTSGPPNSAFQILTVEQLRAKPEPIDYTIEALDICPGRPTQVAGMGFAGKTIALASAITSIIVGRRVWGEFWCKQGPCAHIDYEMGRRASLRRYRRLAAGMGLSWEQEVAPHLRLVSLPSIYLNTAGVDTHLRRIAEGMVLVAIDSLRRALPGEDENDSSITRYLDVLARASEATGATFVFLHHSTTKVRKGDDVDPRGAGRGSSAIYDSSGAVLVLAGAKGEPVRVTHTRAPERGTTAEDFYLQVEDVEVDDDTRGGVRVSYRTVEQVEGVKTTDADVTRDVDRIVEAIRREGPAGVKGADAVSKLAGMKAQAGRAAVGIALSRGLIVNVATLKNGERDERRPLFVTSDVAVARPRLKAVGRGTSNTKSSEDERDEQGTRDEQDEQGGECHA